MKKEERSIVFYDGKCGLCDKSVRLIWKRDHAGVFHFAPLQSEFAMKFLLARGIEEVFLNTIYVHHEGEIYNKSRAVQQIVPHLTGRNAKMASWLLKNCPNTKLTDSLYDLVAKNRHLFGPKDDNCEIPPTSVKKRFLG